MEKSKQDIIIWWTRIVRNIILTICVPISIFYGATLYTKHISILDAHIELLKETQYDKALSLLKAQKELYQREKKELNDRIAFLESSGNNKEEINKLRRQLDKEKIHQELRDEQNKMLKFNKKELKEYMDREFDDFKLKSWDDL